MTLAPWKIKTQETWQRKLQLLRSSQSPLNWMNSKLNKLKREFVNWKIEMRPVTKYTTEKYSVGNQEDSMDWVGSIQVRWEF